MKRLLAFLLSVCLVIGLTACGETSSTSNGGESTPTTDGVSVNVINDTAQYDGFMHYPQVEIIPSDAGDVNFRVFKDGELVSEAKKVGSYSVEVTVTADGEQVAQKTVDFTITPKTVDLKDVYVGEKEYDGNTSFTGEISVREGVVTGEILTANVSGTLSGDAVSENAYQLSETTVTFIGDYASNYTVGEVGGLTAKVTQKLLTIGGITVEEKAYDGTTTATWSGTPELVGVVEGDDVSITIENIEFPSAESGKDIDMVVTATLIGEDAGSYAIASKTGVVGTISVDTSDFEFNTETQTITKYLGNSTSVDIPREINGLEVKAIGDYAFYYESEDGLTLGRPNMKAVYIPNTVVTIGANAFLYSGIETVTIPASVETVGVSAFSYCGNLHTVIFEEGSKCTKIDEWAFSYTAVANINIPSGVTVIPFATFAYCTAESSFTIPVTVTEIGASAFFLNKYTSYVFETAENESEISFGLQAFAGANVTSFEVPARCTYIGGACFQNAVTLKNFTFAPRTKDLIWGEIEQDATDWHLAGTSVESIVIPGAIKSVGSGTFCYVTSLKSVILEEGVEKIDSYAFQGTSVVSINLPKSLKNVGFAAFNECKLLTEITYSEGEDAQDIVFDEWCFARTGVSVVNISSRVVEIKYAVFAFAEKVNTVNISAEGNALTFSGHDVFFASQLTRIVLPSRVVLASAEGTSVFPAGCEIVNG